MYFLITCNVIDSSPLLQFFMGFQGVLKLIDSIEKVLPLQLLTSRHPKITQSRLLPSKVNLKFPVLGGGSTTPPPPVLIKYRLLHHWDLIMCTNERYKNQWHDWHYSILFVTLLWWGIGKHILSSMSLHILKISGLHYDCAQRWVRPPPPPHQKKEKERKLCCCNGLLKNRVGICTCRSVIFLFLFYTQQYAHLYTCTYNVPCVYHKDI